MVLGGRTFPATQLTEAAAASISLSAAATSEAEAATVSLSAAATVETAAKLSSSASANSATPLFGKANERRSSSFLLTESAVEFLNDLQLYCLAFLAPWAGDRTIQSRYPCASEIVPAMFRGESIQRLFRGSGPVRLVLQKYAERLHWHQLLFFADEKMVFYHEPYGTKLGDRADIVKAFKDSLGPSNGWEFKSVLVMLQSCGYECGVWEDFVSEVAVDYATNGGGRGFEAYLRGRAEITPLHGLRGKKREEAKAKNNSFIAKRRCTARTLLQEASKHGRLVKALKAIGHN